MKLKKLFAETMLDNAILTGLEPGSQRRLALHPARQAATERVRRELQRPVVPDILAAMSEERPDRSTEGVGVIPVMRLRLAAG